MDVAIKYTLFTETVTNPYTFIGQLDLVQQIPGNKTSTFVKHSV